MTSERFLAVISVVLVCVGLSVATSGGKAKPEPLLPHEAEILIYLLPEAHKLREEGMDIGWELQTAKELNQADYYTFWVYNAKRVVNGSVTIGYFAINKHTADIWEATSEEPVTSTELEGIQTILRKIHYIDEDTINRYRLRPLSSRG
jgi:hypothetical protein